LILDHIRHIMGQQAPIRLASDLPLFNWEEFRQSTSLPESSRPLLQESATSDINSLLSACSYPLPESYNSQNAQRSTPSPNPGDFALEPASYLNRTNTNQTPVSEPTTPRPQKRQRHGPKKAAPAKNRGAPQEVGDGKENPGERRRMQTRMAQRAYRSRQQATVDGLKSRISLLETSMEKMSSTMLSFSEQLVQSGVLRSHSALTANLRDTMRIFLSTASGASLDDDEIRVPVDSNKTIDSPPASQKLTIKRPPFGLIFSMMNRERLASYFKAELYAQVSQKPLEGWEEVPLFRLGGAGTHYPDGSTGEFVPRYQRWGTVEDPLSLVTSDLRKQLEGDWFDLQDLKGYLQDKNVLLVASAGEPTRCSKVQTNINVSRFISALVSKGVCLGRTPGFQRNNVEEALHFSTIV
ncbi:hypothetical protein N7532_000784, partial [Penicillium argentinense]